MQGEAPVGATQCETVITGFAKLTIPTVWKNGGSECDYLINGPLWIESGMTIEPGTTIHLGLNASLVIREGASLVAVGRPDARIRFVGDADVQGYWSGITFIGAAPSRLEYTDIENAGQAGTSSHAALHGSGTIAMKHSRVAKSYANGAIFDRYLKLTEFQANVFEGNRGFGLTISTHQVSKLDAASDYGGRASPNGEPFIRIAYEPLSTPSTWKDLGTPYYADNSLTLDAALTLEPGTRIALDEGSRISIGPAGSVVARGTADRPVVFTGKLPSAGSWLGFYSLSPGSTLEHVRIEHAGRAERGSAAIEVRAGSFSISDTSFAELGGRPVCGYADASVAFGARVTLTGTSSPVQAAPLCW